MKYIKTSESLIVGMNAANLDKKILDYAKDPKNFPEIENIKEIFQDLNDYLYLNGLSKITFFNNIYMKDNDEYQEINLRKHNHKMSCYKAYRINMILNGPKYVPFREEIYKRVVKDLSRLNKMGFHCSLQGEKRSSPTFIFITIVDPNDRVTMKQILK